MRLVLSPENILVGRIYSMAGRKMEGFYDRGLVWTFCKAPDRKKKGNN